MKRVGSTEPVSPQRALQNSVVDALIQNEFPPAHNGPDASEHNLTPDQRQMPRPVRRLAYSRIPETCDQLRHILDQTAAQITEAYELPPENNADMDAAISWAFLQIRDNITQVFRTEQMRLIQELQQQTWYDGSRLPNEEGDVHGILAGEFGLTRQMMKNALFHVLYAPMKDRGEGEPLLDYCRRKFKEMYSCQPQHPSSSSKDQTSANSTTAPSTATPAGGPPRNLPGRPPTKP